MTKVKLMMIKNKVLTFLTASSLLISSLKGQSFFEKGESFYARRAENATGQVAENKFINAAIKNYKKAKQTPEALAGLLKAYEYKGSYTKQSKKKRKALYLKAMKKGEKALKIFPNYIPIKYYYMANLGRWGQTVSILKAHDKGVVDKIKAIAEEILEEDSTFDQAGAQRVLGGIHLKAPNIPFVLTWPSDEVALRLLSSAYQYAPENIGNCKLYAEALIEMNREDEAVALLRSVVKRSPRASRFLEDLRNIDETKELLANVL